jgi:hypothetical protein
MNSEALGWPYWGGIAFPMSSQGGDTTGLWNGGIGPAIPFRAYCVTT